MTRVSKPKLSDLGLPAQVERDVSALSAGDLGSLTLRELLSWLLTNVGEAERRAYLSEAVGDKGNGSYDRRLAVGSVPVELSVPRTRSGKFRPSTLPERYQRGYPEETEQLLLGMLGSSRSINATKAALRQLGVSGSEGALKGVAEELLGQLELRNTRPLDPDVLAIYVDGKHVEIREGERLRPACIYVVVGVGRDGIKRVLCCLPQLGRESLEGWRNVYRSLIERGLRRVLILVQDDFSGLLGLSRGLFPRADIQLCLVHLQRNARNHLSKEDYWRFQRRLTDIKGCFSEELAQKEFEDLCAEFEPVAPTFLTEVRKKREHYLCFLKYPESARRTLSTTNLVEAINGQLERMRRNNGGYFHSTDTLKLKLAVAVNHLENATWRRIETPLTYCLHQFNAIFDKRFEDGAGQTQGS
jgi:putative transposase